MLRLVASILLLLPTVAFSQHADALKQHVEILASPDFNGRKSGSEGCEKAAAYLTTQLKLNGYSPEYQDFSFGRVKTKNILAARVGPLDSVLIVCAHYDAIGPIRNSYCPGADDNASGVAAVLELTKMIKTSRRTILFILFSGEEDGLIGSRFYVKHPKYPNDKTLFVLNLDMIGYLKPNVKACKPNVTKILDDLYVKYPFAPGVVILGGEDSDHESFADIGIPTAFLHTGLHPYYHKVGDTPDRLNYEGMSQIVLFANDLIKLLDNHDLPSYNIIGTN
jgi:Zn-dependent M28 family amino/carboxypeptidase